MRRGISLVEVLASVFLMGLGTLCFMALFPSASTASRMAGNYGQAISIVQHKVDQLRAAGYGRLNYTDLRTANIVDASPNTQPFRFNTADALSGLLPSPTGTITISSFESNVRQVTVRLTWQGYPRRANGGTHEVTVLIAND